MNRLISALCLALLAVVALAGAATAQDTDTDDDDSFLFRVNGSASIPADETVNAALVVNGDIVVDGHVSEALIVINGTATINGTVGENVTVVRGDLILNAGSEVDEVMLVNSNLTQDPAAVAGDIKERDEADFSLGRGAAVFSFLFWLGVVIVGLVAALVFAWLGRAQLFGSVETLRSDFAMSLVTALALFIGLPIIAFLILFTLIGIPLALTILTALLPALFILGAIVFGTWIASHLIKSGSQAAAIGTAMLGVVILALIVLIPFVGWLVVIVGGILGAGALVYRSFRRASSGTPPQTPQTTPTGAH